MVNSLMIPIEIYTREFLSRLRIAFHYAAQGGTAVIGPQNKIKAHLSRIKSPVNYLSKGEPQTPATIELFESSLKVGSRLFLLDEEGGITNSVGESIKIRYDHNYVSYYTRMYLWGENTAKYVEDFGDKVLLTGNPRFDNLPTEYTFIDPDCEINNFIKDHQFNVQINCSFPSGNSVRSYEELKQFTSGLLGDNFDADEFQLHTANQHLAYLYIKKLIKKISECFPSIGIIIRPHPSENPDGYEDLVSNSSNIYIDRSRELAAAHLARLCNLTIHHDCTTGLEALLAGANVIAFVPFQTEYTQIIPIKSTKNIHTIDGVLKTIDKLINSRVRKNMFLSEDLSLIKENIINFNSPIDTARTIATDLFSSSIMSTEYIENLIAADIYEIEKEERKSIAETIKHIIARVVKQNATIDKSLEYRRLKQGKVSSDSVKITLSKLNAEYEQNIKLTVVDTDLYILKPGS